MFIFLIDSILEVFRIDYSVNTMSRVNLLIICAIVTGLMLFPLMAFALCGKERWSVKTGTDPAAASISLNQWRFTTIATMGNWPRPDSIPASGRIAPYETTVWRLSAALLQYKLEADSDYHLVLEDSFGRTMIAEIASPDCVGSSSPLFPGIQNARKEFDAKYHATTHWKMADVPVTIQAVGMFDYFHGQTGMAKNGIELHPVMDILFSAQLLLNPGFEKGPVSWVSSSTQVIRKSPPGTPHSGYWYALLGGYGKTHRDTLYQGVAIPSGATTTRLSLLLSIDSVEKSTTEKRDTLLIQIRNPSGAVLRTLATYSNLDAPLAYEKKTFDISSYRGQKIGIYSEATENGSAQTSFAFDDFALVGASTTGAICGNGKCESGETVQNCPQDCHPQCDPCYTGPGVCVPPAPPDHNCADLPWKNFHACPADPQGLDGNHDGVACES
jgi:hypothetical protein